MVAYGEVVAVVASVDGGQHVAPAAAVVARPAQHPLRILHVDDGQDGDVASVDG